ncbi:hypothetical protein BEP19_02325 [Ammoniphilus oxalaticus]|uniref:Uncharacterized protein n=1 Tax=Ammoniphilus oxalaticus TaxID=66863 RepID=A0A419SND1_9BACL|nr:hypothetical protein [Ammoniphilus oxalaticus]RKD25796.1 hypothetical protein BEP19_02325 [Ammoniphilus oxalaticus]
MNFVAWMIIASEIGFWIVIVLGLVTRYVLKRNKLGLLLLALTPVIDLILLLATSVDLYRGATATTMHALAAVYIGVSIAYGKSIIQWTDERFRYYVTREGAKPIQRFGMDYAIHYLKSWGRHVLAYLIGAGLLTGMVYLIHNPSRTEALIGALKVWTLALGIDFVISISNFIWPKRKKA